MFFEDNGDMYYNTKEEQDHYVGIVKKYFAVVDDFLEKKDDRKLKQDLEAALKETLSALERPSLHILSVAKVEDTLSAVLKIKASELEFLTRSIQDLIKDFSKDQSEHPEEAPEEDKEESSDDTDGDDADVPLTIGPSPPKMKK